MEIPSEYQTKLVMTETYQMIKGVFLIDLEKLMGGTVLEVIILETISVLNSEETDLSQPMNNVKELVLEMVDPVHV